MSKFINLNTNPHNRQVGDCVVRAIGMATNQTWDETFDELCQIARETKSMPDGDDVYGLLLARHGFQRIPIIVKKNSKRPTVSQMCELCPKQEFIVCKVAHHLVAVSRDGYYDTWDSGDKPLYAYFKKVD
jgi:hypothetical protein